MKNTNLKWAIGLLLLLYLQSSLSAFAQVVIDPDSAKPADPAWEAGFRERVDSLSLYKPLSPLNGANRDQGKGSWNRILAVLYKNRNSPNVQNLLINGPYPGQLDPCTGNNINGATANTIMNAAGSGTYCRAFSVPGSIMFYNEFKNFLNPGQQKRFRDILYNVQQPCGIQPTGIGWDYLNRTDGTMDAIYTATEFNSENFHWMMRMGGYLWAKEFNTRADTLEHFQKFVRNWIRNLYSIGRLEWNSTNYWAYTFIPTQVLYQYAPDIKYKRMAKAGLDWMLLESAIGHVDGFTFSGDIRGKQGGYKGGLSTHNFAYFAGPGHYPSWLTNFPQSLNPAYCKNIFDDFAGFMNYSTYKPAQQIIDIAQHKFKYPVEIQSAKPFYQVDHNDYADYKALTPQSRKFDFVTTFIDSNYVLASTASNRPTGSIGDFSEQNIWKLGIKGTDRPVVFTGNAGNRKDCAGRYAEEEVAQYRNLMLRAIKKDSDTLNKLWIAFPNSLLYDTSGGVITMDAGNGVYVGLRASASNLVSLSANNWAYDSTFTQLTWNFTRNTVGALALEMGTERDYGTIANFKARMLSSQMTEFPLTDAVSYQSASGHTLKLAWQPTTTFQTVVSGLVTGAGVTPMAWGDGNLIDYQKFQAYAVSFGEDIIRQDWGSDKLSIRVAGQCLEINIDTATADPEYKLGTCTPHFVTGLEAKSLGNIWAQNRVKLWPNPAGREINVQYQSAPGSETFWYISDLPGRIVAKGIGRNLMAEVLKIDVSGYAAGIYTFVSGNDGGKNAPARFVIAP